MDEYVCPLCGFTYNAAAGDPEENIPAGTTLEKLPDDWHCPICGASKDVFLAQG